MMDSIGATWRNLGYAIRAMWKNPGFTLTVILVLGTGIGATTAIFSVVDTVVLRPLPYPDSDRLVFFDQGAHSYPVYGQWEELGSLELVAASRYYDLDLTGRGEPRRIAGLAVSPDFFELFGGRALIGRLLVPEDYPGDRSEVVLSHAFWVRLGGDESLLGSTVLLDGSPSEVVGVLAPEFRPPFYVGSAPEVWFALDDGGEFADFHGFRGLSVAARLAPGLTRQAVQEEVDAQRAALAEEEPGPYIRDGSLVRTPLVPMHEATIRGVSSTMLLLLGAVGILLAIACANVANLLLARGTHRAREIALKGAMGASRAQVALEVLTESLVLALAGGLFGIVLAYGGVELFSRFMPGDIPRIDAVSVDARVLWFSLAVSILTGVVFGLLPAAQALRTDLNHTLKEGAASTTASRAGRRLRAGLVVAEIALAVVLVVGAGLLSRTLVAMLRVDPGFQIEGLVVLPLRLPAEMDEQGEQGRFARSLVDELARVPGVESAALAWTTPFTTTGGSRRGMSGIMVGDPALYDEADPESRYEHPVTPEYFETVGISVVRGRGFEDGDELLDPIPTVLTQAAAVDLFGSADPLGQIVRPRTNRRYLVIGVAEPIHHWGLDQEVDDGIYIPYLPGGMFRTFQALVRADRPVEAVAADLRNAVWSIDPDLPLDGMVTMEQRVHESVASPRFLAVMLGTFAAVALLLACGGIYGSMLYTVGQRRREMGIRLALGATGRDVIDLVIGYGLMLAVVGVALGTAVALGMSRLVEQLVWGVETSDPLTFGGTALILVLAALAASFVPAWRASRADPLQTLRAE